MQTDSEHLYIQCPMSHNVICTQIVTQTQTPYIGTCSDQERISIYFNHLNFPFFVQVAGGLPYQATFWPMVILSSGEVGPQFQQRNPADPNSVLVNHQRFWENWKVEVPLKFPWLGNLAKPLANGEMERWRWVLHGAAAQNLLHVPIQVLPLEDLSERHHIYMCFTNIYTCYLGGLSNKSIWGNIMLGILFGRPVSSHVALEKCKAFDSKKTLELHTQHHGTLRRQRSHWNFPPRPGVVPSWALNRYQALAFRVQSSIPGWAPIASKWQQPKQRQWNVPWW